MEEPPKTAVKIVRNMEMHKGVLTFGMFQNRIGHSSKEKSAKPPLALSSPRWRLPRRPSPVGSISLLPLKIVVQYGVEPAIKTCNFVKLDKNRSKKLWEVEKSGIT